MFVRIDLTNIRRFTKQMFLLSGSIVEVQGLVRRGVKTAKKDEVSKDPYFVVFNCPDLYTQVEEVSFKTPFEGLK